MLCKNEYIIDFITEKKSFFNEIANVNAFRHSQSMVLFLNRMCFEKTMILEALNKYE